MLVVDHRSCIFSERKAAQVSPAQLLIHGLRLPEFCDVGRFRPVKRMNTGIAFLALAPLILAAQDMKAPALQLVTGSRPLIIAHRGYSSAAPENTLASFKLAMKAGADFVELDTYHSKDGIPFVLHDSSLDRTTDATNRWGGAKIAPASRTLAELKTLDAGKWFDPQFAGTRLSTLVEALDVIQGGGGMTLVERKEGDPATMAEILTQKRLINRVVVQSFDWQFLKGFHALQPDQVLGALGVPKCLADGTKPAFKDKTLNAQWLDELAKTGAKIAVWNKDVTRESVALAHQRGLKVWVYTIDDPQLANEFLDMGVDGLITNNPGLLWRTLALRALK